MRLSENGKSMIKKFEGLRLDAYRDSAGIWTIGYGSTRYHDGRNVKPHDRLSSESQASALFNNTLSWFEAAVSKLVRIELSQNQFDALVSFTYNVGEGAFASSTLLKKLNLKDFTGAAEQFLLWNKITDPTTKAKKVLPALSARRQQERNLFLKL